VLTVGWILGVLLGSALCVSLVGCILGKSDPWRLGKLVPSALGVILGALLDSSSLGALLGCVLGVLLGSSV